MGREPDEVARQSGPDGTALAKSRSASSDSTRGDAGHTRKCLRAHGPHDPQAMDASRCGRAGPGRSGRAGPDRRPGAGHVVVRTRPGATCGAR